MPRLLFEFQCKDGHISTLFVNTQKKAAECTECGKTATRMMGKLRVPLSQGLDPDMPTAADKWAKMQKAKNTGRHADSNNERYGGRRPHEENQ